MTIIRAAMTQTINCYKPMPQSLEDLDSLASKLDPMRNANLQHHIQLIANASKQGAHIIGLGELFTAPYFGLTQHAFWRNLAENAETGPTICALREVAAKYKIVIVAPIYELNAGNRYNTAVIINSDGKILGKYRKCHIPKGMNDEGSFDEQYYYDASDCNLECCIALDNKLTYFPVFNTSAGRIGVNICYDRHFQGVVTSLASNGAQLIYSPAVTFGSKSRRLWDMEFPVDAARHNVYIGGSNRSGSEEPWNQEYFGCSYFVGPDGALPDISTHREIIISDINLRSLSMPDQSGWNIQNDARLGIYCDALI